MQTLRRKIKLPRANITINKLINIGIATQAFISEYVFLPAVLFNKF